MLIEADPDRCFWPAYIGASGRIALNLAEPDRDLAGERIATSFRLTAKPGRRRPTTLDASDGAKDEEP